MTGGLVVQVLIGYGYHPTTTGTYLQKAFARHVETLFVGTSYAGRPGYEATADINGVVADGAMRPDLYLYIDSGSSWYFPRGLPRLESATACYLIDVHVDPKAQLQRAMFFDYAFTAQKDFVPVLKAHGHPEAHWLPLACDRDLYPAETRLKRYDIGFVGAIRPEYERRRALLKRLGSRFTVNDYRTRYSPAEMARLYAESRLVFNCSLGQEVNMRVFEGAASGSLLLTDRIGNGLSELVTDRRHVLMYSDADIIEIAAEFLEDREHRESLARAGRAHILAHHTYDHRARTILDVTRPGRLQAPLRQAGGAEVSEAYAAVYSRAGRIDDTLDEARRLPRGRRARGLVHVALAVVRRLHYG